MLAAPACDSSTSVEAPSASGAYARLVSGRLGLAVACILSSLALSIAVTVVSWVIQRANAPPPETFELTIPAGTAAAISGGDAPSSIPGNLVLLQGDTLRIANQDSVVHRIGTFSVEPGQVQEFRISGFVTSAGSSNRFACTFHPAGNIEIGLGKDASILSTLLPALALCAPLAAASYAVIRVTSRLA